MVDEVDIMYSLEHTEAMVVFLAQTKKGEDFMGNKEVSVPATSADQYKEDAIKRLSKD
jgi:hypothetical protein